MAENRRVEARSIIGNGNVTDPESILELEEEWGRRVRGNTPRPQKKFGTVVEEEALKVAERKNEDQDTEPTQTLENKAHLPKTIVPKLGQRLIRI